MSTGLRLRASLVFAAFAAFACLAANAQTVFTVTNTQSSGAGSLAAVLVEQAAACPSASRIEFAIPAATDPNCNAATGICKIQGLESLRMRCSNTVMDGYTQPGASANARTDMANDAHIKIEIEGPGPDTTKTLQVVGSDHAFGANAIFNVTIRGFAFPRHNVELRPANSGSVLFNGGGHVVSGNWFGWHADGTTATGVVSKGVSMYGAYMSGVTIGGPAPADRNLFTHRNAALCCEFGSRGIYGEGIEASLIEGNYINVSPAGLPVSTNGMVGAIGLTGGLSGGTPYARNITVRNNVIYNIASGMPMGLGMAGGIRVSRNIVTGHVGKAWGFFTVASGGERNDNPPQLTGRAELPGEVRISGTVTGPPNGNMRLEFFHNSLPSDGNTTSAERFAGELDVTLDPSGNGSFVASLPPDTRNVSASVANLANGDTSTLVQPVSIPSSLRTLTVARIGDGVGSVTSSPGGLACGATCSAGFEVGSSVTLTAAAQAGSVFTGWGGACSGTEACVLAMSDDRSVTAAFTLLGALAEPLDMNGDGRSDVVYRNASTGQVYRFLANGLVLSSGAHVYAEANTAWDIVGDGDFDGNGFADLLYRNAASGEIAMVRFGSGGTVIGAEVFYSEPSAHWVVVQTPDLDGDGRSDLVWRNSVTGQVFVMLMQGPTVKAQAMIYAEADTQWRIVASGDFTASGKKNGLLWRNSTTGELYLQTVTYGGGSFSLTGATIYREADTAWRLLAAADFDGDGKSDLLWRNTTTGQVWMMIMNGNAIASQGPVHNEPSAAWVIVAQGDYDGDGKADLLWRNSSSGAVYMMLMNGRTIASQGAVYSEPDTAWEIMGPGQY